MVVSSWEHHLFLWAIFTPWRSVSQNQRVNRESHDAKHLKDGLLKTDPLGRCFFRDFQAAEASVFDISSRDRSEEYIGDDIRLVGGDWNIFYFPIYWD